ncbi:MAG: hypothetical protein ACREJS_11725 [Candidatus Rokuibacteriota bacterium]
MTTHRRAARVLASGALIAALTLTSAPGASASPAVTTRRDGPRWLLVDAAIRRASASRVVTKVYRPRRDGSRVLHYRCGLLWQDAGTYTCTVGLDRRVTSISGRWVARVFVDGARVGSHRFRP